LRAAFIFWFLCSAGGVIVVLLAGVGWLYARPKSRAPRVFLALVAVGYMLASVYAVPHSVERWISAPFHALAERDIPSGRNVVVLLGSGSYRRLDWSDVEMSVLDPIGTERTLEAARVFRLAKAEYVISSGGVIDPESLESPAGVTMQSALVGLGVPSDRIVVERDSTNTREEALNVAAMLPALGAKHVILVTSAIHMRRAVGMFRAAGVDVIPAVARQPDYVGVTDYFLPSQEGLRTTALVVHELAGLTFYRIRGWYKSH
jgi:uncharacterized SAM-binding protein YcdF (DUF218 family)